jgi:hypothetical protein
MKSTRINMIYMYKTLTLWGGLLLILLQLVTRPICTIFLCEYLFFFIIRAHVTFHVNIDTINAMKTVMSQVCWISKMYLRSVIKYVVHVYIIYLIRDVQNIPWSYQKFAFWKLDIKVCRYKFKYFDQQKHICRRILRWY